MTAPYYEDDHVTQSLTLAPTESVTSDKRRLCRDCAKAAGWNE